jgi:hypothetical protein
MAGSPFCRHPRALSDVCTPNRAISQTRRVDIFLSIYGQLAEQPNDSPPSIRPHRQEVDDVGQPVSVCSLFQEEKRPRPAEATFLSERGCADRGPACLTPENAS